MSLSDKVIKAKNVKVVTVLPAGHKHVSRSDEKLLQGSISASATPVSADQQRLKAEAKILEQARKEAYDRGFSEGVNWQKKHNLLSLKAIEDILGAAQSLKKSLYADAEEQMLNLVLTVAEKVIYEDVSANKKAILAVLREAVKSVLDREGMKIRLNPRDYAFVKEMDPDLIMGLDGARNIAFEEDAAITPGGAILETNAGEVDARLEQRIKEIKTSMKIN